MKVRTFLRLCILLFLPVFAYAQNQTLADGANSITIPELRDHMYYLASDELEGRFPGTPGYDKAAEYAVTQFKHAGLKPMLDNGASFLQPVFLRAQYWDEKNNMTVNSNSGTTNYRMGEDFIIMWGEASESMSLSGEMVFVSLGIVEPEHGIDNYRGIDAKGKWVLMYSDLYLDSLKAILPPDIFKKYELRHTGQRLREKYAREAGAIGILMIPHESVFAYWDALAYARKKDVLLRDVENPTFKGKFNTVLINEGVTSDLFEGQKINPMEDKFSMKSFHLRKTTLDLKMNFFTEDFTSYNVIGLVEGSDPVNKSTYITVGAHLDHMGIRNGEIINGADDNASGSVGIIELAEAVALSNPRQSVLFILYTAEEMGLLGSWYFTECPTVSIPSIKANINLDMLGRSDNNVEKGISPILLDKEKNMLMDHILEVHQKFPSTDLDWEYADTCKLRSSSDHYSFHVKGIPSVFFFDGTNPDIHTPRDDTEKIDFEYFQKNCQFIYYLIMDLANTSIEVAQIPNWK